MDGAQIERCTGAGAQICRLASAEHDESHGEDATE